MTTPAALSASKMERVAACTASAILPSFPHTGKLAIAGTERHANLEEGKPAEDKADAFDPRSLDLPNVEHEVAYVIDPKQRSVKRIGAGMPRAYGVDRPWYTIGTTLDVESVALADNYPARATAVDWKSRKRVTAAKRNWQVRLQALALWEHYHVPVRSGLVYLDNGEQDFHSFTRFDHAATWADIDRAVSAVEAAIGREPKPHMGPWCEYCDAVVACPAVNQALRGLMEQVTDKYDLSVEGGMPACDVAQLHPVLKAIKKKYDIAWEALRLRAKQENLPLGNGRHLRMIENNRGVWMLSERKDEEAA